MDDRHDVARRLGQPGGQGDLVSEIARQRKDSDTRIGAWELAKYIQRGVATAVIDVNDSRVGAGQALQRGAQPGMGAANNRLFIVARHDHR